MKRGEDISRTVDGVQIIHQNMPERIVAEHKHSEHHLFLPLRGAIELGASGQTFVVRPGEMSYIPSHVPHTFASEEGAEGERLICMFDHNTWTAMGGTEHRAAVLPVHQLLKEIAFYLLLNSDSAPASALAVAMVKTLEAQLTEIGVDASTRIQTILARARDPRLVTIIDYIQKNYYEKIAVPDLPQLGNMSLRTMTRLFESELGLSPVQVITRVRIEAACDLLAGKKMTVTNVAFEVGFGSLSRFIECFRAVTGVLPSDYRAS